MIYLQTQFSFYFLRLISLWLSPEENKQISVKTYAEKFLICE